MDLKQYNSMVEATDRLRASVDEDTAEAVLNTLSCSMQAVEQYCIDNIKGFKQNGKVINRITTTDEELSQEFEIVVNGKALTDEELEPHFESIGKILDELYSNLGWGEL